MSKKEQIRLAAIKVISKEGFFHATTDKIAKEANVAVGTIYNYFSSKEDILDHILETESKKRIDYYTQIKNSGIEWFEKIEQILSYHFKEMVKEPDVTKIILAEKINAARNKLVSLKYYAKMPEILSDILAEALSQDKLKQCDVKIISVIIFGSIESIMVEFIINRNEDFLSQALKEICGLLKDGLMK